MDPRVRARYFSHAAKSTVRPSFFHSRYSAVAVSTTSEEEFSAVSQESWTTPMMKPTATTCMAMSLSMPNSEHASGIRSREPPGTPEAPAAPMAARADSRTAVGISGNMPVIV